METICQEGLVRGRVQGVAYRAYCVHCAQNLSITGHTRNLADGSVCVVAYGEAERLETFWGMLREGPPLARVDNIIISNRTSTDRPQHFKIIF